LILLKNKLKKITFKDSEFGEIPTYTINLDKDPKERWTEVCNDYKDKFPTAM